MKPVILLAAVAALAMTAAAQQPAPTKQAQQPAPTKQAQQPNPSFGAAGMEGLNPASTASSVLTLSISQPAACPVSLKASFNSRSQMVKVRKPGEPEPAPGPAQHIRVVVADPEHQRISSATVTAYGLTARTRLDRSADPFAIGASGVRRTMTVPLVAGEKAVLYADMHLPGFTAVQGVKLESIRFADGSKREFADKALCSVPVDPIMLVSER